MDLETRRLRWAQCECASGAVGGLPAEHPLYGKQSFPRKSAAKCNLGARGVDGASLQIFIVVAVLVVLAWLAMPRSSIGRRSGEVIAMSNMHNLGGALATYI